jgi:uncharacterized delta-60 repeat protein
MRTNIHEYPFKINDIVFTLADDAVTLREGTVVSIPAVGITQYGVLMQDTSAVENFDFENLYGLASYAEIYKNTFLSSPTPSVSKTPSVSLSRTPKVTVTPSLTPSGTPVVYPNLLNPANLTWTAAQGTVTLNNNNGVLLTSTGTVPSDDVSFYTTVTVQPNSIYDFYSKLNKGTNANLQIELLSNGDSQIFTLSNDGTTNDYPVTILENFVQNSTEFAFRFSTESATSVKLYMALLSSTPNSSAPAKGTYNIDKLSLKYVPASSIAPTPTSSVAPSFTPSATPNAAQKQPVSAAIFKVNAAGLVDSTFNSPFPKYSSATAAAIVGSNVYVSVRPIDTGVNEVSRLNLDGTNDSSYTPLVFDSNPVAITKTSDGKIYLGGYFNNYASGGNTYSNLLRLNSDGTVDTSFIPVSFNSEIFNITELNNGQILVTGQFSTVNGQTNTGVARLNSDGSFDASYTDIGVQTNKAITQVLKAADGTIYIGGTFSSINSVPYNYLARLNSDGTLDTTFVNIGLGNYLSDINQNTSGKIYISGNLFFATDMVRLNSDGTLDSTYTPYSASIQYSVSGMLTGGKFIVGGLQGSPALPTDQFGEFNADGSVNTSFKYIGANFTAVAMIPTADGGCFIVGG